ncbi:DUF58 domain-containing protein [Acinetobacter soli]|uniref:DUF58 domain-containing protein n=1 Tax=Acinetobacter soli TaxID=487316 RepID=UPI00209195E4|nr:DUF58 domain-containing protein [Acinetobacter soli]
MMRTLWQRWLKKRFRMEQSTILNQRDILIFLHPQGILFLLLTVITFIAGINYANNLILGFCFLITSLLCMSVYLSFKQLHQLKLEIVCPEVGQVNHVLQIQLQFKQSNQAIRYLMIHLPESQQRILLNEMSGNIALEFTPTTRGAFELPRIKIMSSYPFGIVQAWTYLQVTQKIWIAPASISIEMEDKYVQLKQQHDLDDFRELQTYREGDTLQHVSWKHLARGQGWLTKQFEPHIEHNQLVIDYSALPGHEHEQKLSWMMHLIEMSEQADRSFLLILPQTHLKPSMGAKHSIQARKLLAQA